MDYNLPEPDYQYHLNYADGYNEDIRKTIHNNFPVAVKQTRAFAQQFKGNSARETAYTIWKFIKDHCIYQKDAPKMQCIKLPSRFIHEQGHSDCKSFALTSAALLANNGLPVSFRYANYRGGNIPSHVYTVTRDEDGKEIIVDAVWKYFDSEKKPSYKFDEPMKVYTLSGTDGRPEATPTDAVATDAKFLNFVQHWSEKRGIDMADMKTKNPERFAKTIAFLLVKFNQWHQKKRGFRKMMNKRYDGNINEMISGIDQDIEDHDIGSFFGKLFKGIKTAALAPLKFGLKAGKKLGLAPVRHAFRALVHVNFKGLAQKLKKLNDKAPKEVEKKWKSVGGSYKSLLSSVRHGYNHWATKHKKGAMTGLYGCDIPVLARECAVLGIYDSASGSVTKSASSIFPIIGLAASVIGIFAKLFHKHKVDDPAAVAAGKESSTDSIIEAAQGGLDKFNQMLPSSSHEQLTMDDPTDPNNPTKYDFQKGVDDTPDSEAGFHLNLPTILLFGGGAALLLGAFKHRK